MNEFWRNEYWLLAFVITPAIVVALGWGAVWLHLYASRRQERLHPENNQERPAKTDSPPGRGPSERASRTDAQVEWGRRADRTSLVFADS